MSSVEEGTQTFWRMSQKFNAMTSQPDQDLFFLNVLKPMAEQMTNQTAITLMRRFIARVENERPNLRPTVDVG